MAAGGHNITSCRNVLPPGECTHSVFPHLCSSARQFLIYEHSFNYLFYSAMHIMN